MSCRQQQRWQALLGLGSTQIVQFGCRSSCDAMVVVQWLMGWQDPQRVSSISMASLEETNLFEANN
jgi:hypothetical protein